MYFYVFILALSDECLRLLNYTMGLIIVAVIDAFHFEVAEVGEALRDEGTNELRISIRDKLNKDLLPKLTKCINGKSAELGVHRKARTATTKYYSEDDDIQRAPVALAMVKLLQKVPDSIRSQYLHGVVLKLCSLMISRSMNVRETARKVTVQVCECLGPRYLPLIIKEMKLIMNKGFQIIVQEQFTVVAEEKEVGEIKAEVSEAKKNPTPGTLLLLGRYVSSSAVGVLLKRFMTVVDSLTSSKMISRAKNLLSMFANGLKDNKGFAPTSQLILIHQMLITNIEKMKTVSGNEKDTSEYLEEEHKSCLLLPPVYSQIN
ncbi:unnamed protein product [Strongylus vulgaris]|uniref:U3 small nucleolar RNA-associated protein 20 domain-containing protein n=1 Tax=Strongylus vulgaris TaxID=40348 RepID=A0A3P7JV20_STRVU|nr:unnamed protein product [Strongylus vulgaris]